MNPWATKHPGGRSLAAEQTDNTDYAIVKHMVKHHQNQKPDFAFKAHMSWKSSLERQLGEAQMIDSTPVDEIKQQVRMGV